MKPFYLTEITTKDGYIHHGMYFLPKNPGRRALLWIHGLTGKFYGDTVLINEFANICEKNSWGFASFNNRGHDQIAGVTIVDKTNSKEYRYGNIGAGYEKFEKCVSDIHAAVDFLVSKGFSDIILIGHSTGATKACYSEGTFPHKNVKGDILTGPLSDRLTPEVTKEEVNANICRMEELIGSGRGDELITGLHFFPITPRRYISLFKKGSKEDVFDYDDEKNGLSVFSRITKPLCVMLSQNDEYANRPVEQILSVFDSKTTSTNYISMVFPDANHGFDGKEKEVVGTICGWISSI